MEANARDFGNSKTQVYKSTSITKYQTLRTKIGQSTSRRSPSFVYINCASFTSIFRQHSLSGIVAATAERAIPAIALHQTIDLLWLENKNRQGTF